MKPTIDWEAASNDPHPTLVDIARSRRFAVVRRLSRKMGLPPRDDRA